MSLLLVCFGACPSVLAEEPVAGGIDVPVFDSGTSPVPAPGVQPFSGEPQFFGHGYPNSLEQLMIEWVNRARADPGAEAARLGIDLNEDLPPGTIADTPKPPLAFHPLLIDAARAHSQWMLDTNVFSHTGVGGSSPGDRMVSAGYSLTGSWTWGENISWRGTTGTPDLPEYTVSMHEGLFLSEGHRENLMNPDFEDLGIGLVPGQFFYDTRNWNSLMGTQKFARSAASTGPLLVGVAYDDIDGNGFYDVGEGLEGVDVRLTGGDFYTLTSSSGGFALPYGGVGEMEVVFSGGPLQGTFAATFHGTGQNIKLDYLLQPRKVVRDFDGDGRTDLFWRHEGIGRNVIWFMDGAARTGAADTLGLNDPDWHLAGFGDFDGDGTADILWRSQSTGRNVIWFMDGATRTGSADTVALSDPTWELAALRDFDGDGKTDLLWRNTQNGRNVIWFMDGATRTSAGDTLGLNHPHWHLAGFGDFNGDGKTDFLWRNSVNGRNVIWLMDGLTRIGHGDTVSLNDPAWELSGLEDFDGDGKTDFLWRNTDNGRHVMWFMDGATRTDSGDSVGLNHPDWGLTGFGDFNGDGRSDFLWHNEVNGRNVMWFMDGTTRIGAGDTVTLPLDPWFPRL